MKAKPISVGLIRSSVNLRHIWIGILAISLCLIFFSCDDETPSTVQGGGRLTFEVTVDPPLDTGITGLGRTNSISIVTAFTSIGWSGMIATNQFTSGISEEISVTKGQNIGLNISLDNTYDYVCRDVTVLARINGSVFDTRLNSMGLIQPTTQIQYCNDGTSISHNFIIP